MMKQFGIEFALRAIIFIAVYIRCLLSRKSSSSLSSFLPVNDTYQKCKHYEDTNGEWRTMHLVYRNHTIRHDMLRHFYGGGPKEAIKFTNIWIPYNCSYHRFTNVTVDKCVTYLLRRINHENVDINDHQHTNNVSDQYADHHHHQQQQHTNTSYNHNHDHDHNHDNYDIRSTNIHHLDSLRNNSMDSADSHNVDNNSLNGYNRVFSISSNHHNHNQHLHDYNNNELKYNRYDYNISNHHNYSHKIINNHYNHHRLKIRKKLRIVFFGDSATRGIINGITRILSGSEIFGPCVSDICGRPGASPPSEREHNQHKIYTYHQLIITFIYTKSLTIPYTLQHIESILKENKTYALILNTGAWDFDHVSRAYKNNTALDECGKQAMHEVSKLRTSSIINESMWRFSELAAKYHTRIIYRNNHFNRRFGTICADAEFESMIYGSNWEIWNNREISRDSWVEQTYDGFHFDRNRVHSEEDHRTHRGYHIAQNYEKPGQLEIQLAQSLLQSLFYDCVSDTNFKI